MLLKVIYRDTLRSLVEWGAPLLACEACEEENLETKFPLRGKKTELQQVNVGGIRTPRAAKL